MWLHLLIPSVNYSDAQRNVDTDFGVYPVHFWYEIFCIILIKALFILNNFNPG